ncbi:ShlB/FhaC/HecB family hemolysin secretion/activation protein [Helicobacter cholecystus]|uniref:ShlB/FhaC/HecB family hemolysin secretion/activation protein n=1 Tax=Helicobacter cholecystus TaxID=45498 RepID=A0A3D8IZN2_9HELI|nr:ShlB/FhaC/HecB family hemolysin secretion/activation protein [Helicobacter cholecystus]RDU70084.1 ShlB/FhaC/HecB family hemolysin secretion/activation protein [Helicobacter cholecystus]VEJ24743.1 TpsB transporter [Helicobacter cholecystus]
MLSLPRFLSFVFIGFSLGLASCFPISTIEFVPSETSLKVIEKEKIFDELTFLNSYLSSFAHSCLSVSEISLLLEELNKSAIKEGYITTKFGLIPQDLKSGVLKIGIEVGIIDELEFRDNSTLMFFSKDFAIKKGDILNNKEIEFGLSNIRRNKYLDPKVIITPLGEGSRVEIVVNKKALPLFFSATLDNGGSTGVRDYGSSSLDKFKSFLTSNIQSSFLFGIENPTYLGDTLSFFINNSIPFTQGAHCLYASASYALPIRRALLELSGSYSQSASTLELDFSSPINSSKSWSFSSKLSYLLLSNVFHSLSLGIGWNIKDTKNFLDKVELEVQRKFLSDVSLFLNYKHYFGISEFMMTLSLLQGISAFGSNKILGDHNPYLYTIPTLDFYLNIPFTLANQSFNFSSMLKTQISQSDLYASEKMNIGGRASVRGFDGLSLSEQIGVIYRNDLVIYLPSVAGVIFAPSLGLDAGYVQDFKESVDQYNFLSGGGVGIKMFASYFNMEFWWYYPIYNPYKVQTQSFYLSFGVNV